MEQDFGGKVSSNKLQEKTLSSKQVYSGAFLKVTQDQVELSDGSKSVREYIKHPGAALIVPVLADGRYVMLRQYRHPLNKIFIEFPAGKIDQGESSLQTAQRELLEETGYQANKFDFLTTIHPCIGYSDEKIDLYLATGLEEKSEAKPEHGELLETLILSQSELGQLISSGQLSDVKTLIAALWIKTKGLV